MRLIVLSSVTCLALTYISALSHKRNNIRKKLLNTKCACFDFLYNILICIQQDATLHSLFYMETALHVSGCTITQHQERKQLYLQHLVFVTPLLLSAAIVEEMELV
jgi:hypothetical protein